VRALFYLVIALAGVWLWRSLSAAGTPPSVGKNHPEIAPATMVQCRHCGVHLPATEAITGANGVYCSQAHLQQAET